jgi:tetratricopeptide (TPR) repeat protein
MPSQDIREQVQKLETVLSWLVEIWRTRNWLRVLLLVEAILLLFLNPLMFGQAAILAGITVPKWYTIIWSLLIASVFIVALFFAKRAVRTSSSSNIGERQAIRGLRPYTRKDAGIFPKLQRDDILKECLISICDEDFRFGILCGESGSGKSSFLQAGLWPNLSNESHSCVYVKFNEQSPLESIRQAIVEEFKVAISGDDLLSIFQSIPQSDNKHIVFLFDQFEQFFVHQNRRIDREAFVNDLARWYKSKPIQRQKIIVSVRGDFSDRLIELQKAMGYSLGPQEIFRLEKFEPAQAAAVFGVFGEVEHIDVDQNFVKEVVTYELASPEDGLISPVDVQVLAWMIAGQQSSEQRALNRVTYQRLGGVDGLLEMFLKRALDARETPARRQAAIQVLVALTDLEKNTRAGTLTEKEITERARGTFGTDDLSEAIQWLARGDVRLITPNDRKGIAVYELAHERLISAIRRVTGKELSEIEKTNSLAERRTNEWLGNDRSSRYLLTWSELRKIARYNSYLSLGESNSAKRLLIARSKKRLILRIAVTSATLLIPVCIAIWWFSPFGQIWQAKRALLTLTTRVTDPRSMAVASQALAVNHNFPDAKRIAFYLTYSYFDDSVVPLMAAYIQAGQKSEAAELFDSLFLSPPVHTNPHPVLPLEHRDKIVVLTPQVVEISKALGKEDEMLKTIGIHAKHTFDEYQYDDSDRIQLLATLYVQLGHFEKAIAFVERFYDVSRLKDRYVLEPDEILEYEMHKDLTLSRIYLQVKNNERSSELADVVYAKLKTNHSKPVILQLVGLYSDMGNYQRVDELLNLFPSDPLQTGSAVIVARIKSNLKLAVKLGYFPRLKFALEYLKQLKNLQQQGQRDVYALYNSYTDDSFNSLREGAKVAYEEFGSSSVGKKQLEDECNSLRDFSTDQSDQAWLVAVVAVIAAKSGDYENSYRFIHQAEGIINGLDQEGKSELYPIIVEALALNGDWSKARETAILTGNDTGQLLSLAKIMDIWNKRK